MGRKRKQRRQPHGAAWHWKQTDCWYYTMPGTKKRGSLFGKDGERIRGKENKGQQKNNLPQSRLSLRESTYFRGAKGDTYLSSASKEAAELALARAKLSWATGRK